MAEMGQKYCCYTFMWHRTKEELDAKARDADDCDGVLATETMSGFSEEGYYIQVCPRISWLGRQATCINYCGNGPDVIVLHRDTIPSPEEFRRAADDADNDW